MSRGPIRARTDRDFPGAGQNADLCHAILDDMERFGIPIEGLHTETGPGVYEVAIKYDEFPLKRTETSFHFLPSNSKSPAT